MSFVREEWILNKNGEPKFSERISSTSNAFRAGLDPTYSQFPTGFTTNIDASSTTEHNMVDILNLQLFIKLFYLLIFPHLC